MSAAPEAQPAAGGRAGSGDGGWPKMMGLARGGGGESAEGQARGDLASGRPSRCAPLLPADLDGGRSPGGGARHAGGSGGGQLKESAGVWRAGRGMNEPGRRHGGGGRRRSHGAGVAGPPGRQRIGRGRLARPTPPTSGPLVSAGSLGVGFWPWGAASRRFGGGWAAPAGRPRGSASPRAAWFVRGVPTAGACQLVVSRCAHRAGQAGCGGPVAVACQKGLRE